MLSWRSRCSSTSSGTVRENAVSSSCIVAPEGPVACRVAGDTRGRQLAQWWPGVSHPSFPTGPPATDKESREALLSQRAGLWVAQAGGEATSLLSQLPSGCQSWGRTGTGLSPTTDPQ